MKISEYIFLVCLIGAILSGCNSEKRETNIDQKLNVIFVLADDLGYMDLSYRGSEFYETPNIDKFAKGCMEFTEFYSAPTCAPTRSALITGKSPARLNITCVGRLPGPELAQNLPKTEYSLPKTFKALGYQTAVFGKWGIPGPVDKGFDVEETGGGVVHSHFYPWYKGGVKSTLPVAKEGEYLADVLTSEACKFMESAQRKPFFIYLPYYGVHTPLEVSEELKNKYENKACNGDSLNPVYAGMVENLDTNFGKLLNKVKELGLAENTIIIFTSDNGGLMHFWGTSVTSNIPLKGEKGMLYEGGIRVPFFIRWPGVTKAENKCNIPVAIEDIVPTLSEVIGCDIPDSISKEMDGKSIIPLLKGDSLNRRDLYWHYPHYHDRFEAHPASAIRSGDWKLIDFLVEGRQELYNLKNDIGESHDLTTEYPEKAKELSDKLDMWRKKVNAKIPPTPEDVARTWGKNEQGVYIKKSSQKD